MNCFVSFLPNFMMYLDFENLKHLKKIWMCQKRINIIVHISLIMIGSIGCRRRTVSNQSHPYWWTNHWILYHLWQQKMCYHGDKTTGPQSQAQSQRGDRTVSALLSVNIWCFRLSLTVTCKMCCCTGPKQCLPYSVLYFKSQVPESL